MKNVKKKIDWPWVGITYLVIFTLFGIFSLLENSVMPLVFALVVITLVMVLAYIKSLFEPEPNDVTKEIRELIARHIGGTYEAKQECAEQILRLFSSHASNSTYVSNLQTEKSEGFANTLFNEGYLSCEICFNVKLKRAGIMEWLENKKIINPKTEGFALIIKDWDNVVVLSSNLPKESIVSITSTKINGLR